MQGYGALHFLYNNGDEKIMKKQIRATEIIKIT